MERHSSQLDFSVHLFDDSTKQSSVSLRMRRRADHQESGVDLRWLSHSYPLIRNYFSTKLQRRGEKGEESHNWVKSVQ